MRFLILLLGWTLMYGPFGVHVAVMAQEEGGLGEKKVENQKRWDHLTPEQKQRLMGVFDRLKSLQPEERKRPAPKKQDHHHGG